LLIRVRLPLEAPDDCGEYVTFKVLLCPAARVTAVVNPLMLKLAPLRFACVIVREALPALLMVSVWSLDAFAATFPKFRLAGETPIAA